MFDPLLLLLLLPLALLVILLIPLVVIPRLRMKRRANALLSQLDNKF